MSAIKRNQNYPNTAETNVKAEKAKISKGIEDWLKHNKPEIIPFGVKREDRPGYNNRSHKQNEVSRKKGLKKARGE
jgi:hypothetical protein